MRRKVTLPEGPGELFYAMHRMLKTYLAEEKILLGGGTALAARWKHRHSTDIDLFVDGEAYRTKLHPRQDEFREALEREVPSFMGMSIAKGHCELILGHGEVSLLTSPSFTGDPRSQETVRGTAVYLERSAEILSRKMGSRMLENGTIVPRDLYDIAVAAIYEKSALSEALECIGKEGQREIYDELRSLPRHWMAQAQPPVLSPRHPDHARNAVRIVCALLRQSGETEEKGRQPGEGREKDR